MDIYARFGIAPVINAASSLTRLGGSTLPAHVVTAMTQASQRLVDITEFSTAIGATLARLTRNEAAHVTPGAAAGLVLGILGFRTQGRLDLIARLPNHISLPDEIIMFCAHRNPYDHAVLLAGAKIRQVGNVKQTFEYELEAAIGPQTAGILYVAGANYQGGGLSLADTTRVASSHGVPVIVDAAAQVPPVENLWRYTTELGADLAVFSGGKQLRGPQASGLAVGKASAINAMRANAAPHQRFARAMKVGKEEMAGLLAAVEHFVGKDHVTQFNELMSTCQMWAEVANQHPSVTATIESRNVGGAHLPRVRLEFTNSTLEASAIERTLWEQIPRIAILTSGSTSLYLEPEQVPHEDAHVVIDRVLDAADLHDVK